MQNSKILEKTENGMKESYKILIQELVLDLEKKGVFPVWSYEGKIKKLKIIDENELENFEQAIRKFKMEKSDFCLLEEDETNYDGAIYGLFGKVIIINKKNGKIREYKTGNSSHWVCDFENDLESKLFD